MLVLLLLACTASSPVTPAPMSSAVAQPAPAAPTPEPGFVSPDREFRKCTAAGPDAPIYLTVSLNINDFLRPADEAKAVRRFLESAVRMGIAPLEVSFTGEVLYAINQFDAGAVKLVNEQKPTILEHYRLLDYTGIKNTERELFWTDPRRLTVDRSRPGSLVLIQQLLGVTPRDNGGVTAEMLRRTWKRGAATEALRAQGVKQLDRDSLLIHPDRIIGAALVEGGSAGQSGVDAYREVYRRITASAPPVAAADTVGSLHAPLVAWAQVAGNMGADLAAVPGLSRFVAVSRLGGFTSRIEDVVPESAEIDAIRAALGSEAAAVVSDMNLAFERLHSLTRSRARPADELAARLASLPSDQCFMGRVSWHASDDFTLERWSEGMIGGGPPRPPLPLKPALYRPEAEQRLITDALDAMLLVLVSHPRVKIISLDNDTQRDPANLPAAGYPAVFGVSFDSVPGSLDPAALDAKATAAGIKIPKAPEFKHKGPPPTKSK